jgi:hypothetical protein
MRPEAEQALAELRVFHKVCGDCAHWGINTCAGYKGFHTPVPSPHSPACTSFEERVALMRHADGTYTSALKEAMRTRGWEPADGC